MRRRLRNAGALILERMRTIAAEYRCGERVCLRTCVHNPGTIAEVACVNGRIRYRIAWDDDPGDDRWYDEHELRRLPKACG
jgi:hypothetical protein